MIPPELVAVELDASARYPEVPPYHPSERYPELGNSPLGARNDAFRLVRSALWRLGLDQGRQGQPSWNPLGDVVRPGERVVLKPNMIRQSHEFRPDWDYVITHGSVVRVVAEYVALALNGRGTITITDGPQTDSDYARIRELMGLDAIAAYIRENYGVPVEVFDLRRERWVERDGIYVERVPLPGDPRGYTRVDLGGRSRFVGAAARRLYGAYYDVEETNSHHSGGRHEYMFSSSVLAADVFINLPKLKSHKKCGATLNLKNLVGCNGDKNWLPHYSLGSPSEGGDQFPDQTIKHSVERRLVGFAKRRMLEGTGPWLFLARRLKRLAYHLFGGTHQVVRSGNWWGNDTIWRMILDLNAILLYANQDGGVGSTRRRCFSVVDGIRAGEGNGPMAPDPVNAGLILAGTDPAAVDVVATSLIGFDYRKILHMREAFGDHPLPISAVPAGAVRTVSSDPRLARGRFFDDPPLLYTFEPHFGWKGHIERDVPAAAA
jgi:uncharacterized protein (DUF362 family)